MVQLLVACVRPGDSKHWFVLFVAVSARVIGLSGLFGHRMGLSYGVVVY